MSIGIICCRVLENEVKALIQDAHQVSHLEVMEWGLHIEPDHLLERLIQRIEAMQDHVDAIMLGYGRCQALDRLPNDFSVPLFRPMADDCIGVLLGQQRYEEELLKDGGTWFFSPGWTELGMEFIFQELHVSRFAEKGLDPLKLAHRMLEGFKRGLFIEMNTRDQNGLLKKAQEISEEFNFRLEKTSGSLSVLQNTLDKALKSLPHRKRLP
jgi:hypothetical protein